MAAKMSKRSKIAWLLTPLASLVLLLGFASGLQRPSTQEAPPPEDSIHPDQKAKMDRERREESFRKLKDNTEKLNQVTIELKEMIEKSNQYTYSLQILKKIDEVEKVLKDVKRQAKEGFQ